MLNIIRTTPSRIKYCGRTVDALIASNRTHRTDIAIVSDPQKRSLNNAINQLEVGVKSGEDWFVLMEDDIEFISDFDESVRLWIRDCEGSDSLCYPLAAAYRELGAVKGIAWKWPIEIFYGTQAVAFSKKNATSLLEYLRKPDFGGHEFDLQIKDWARKNGAKHFLTPRPSFVQHVGVHSSLHKNRFHWFEFFGGNDWSYVPHSTAFSPKEATQQMFDESLANGIAEYLAGQKVYDCGCGIGKYVAHLRSKKIDAVGFDVTPGCESKLVIEADLSRDQKFNLEKGGVMSLEVAEHIHAEDEDTFLRNLDSLCARRMVFSWAIPGQGGYRHVNERDAAYVVGKMAGLKYQLNQAMTSKLRAVATVSWFKKSVYVFERTP